MYKTWYHPSSPSFLKIVRKRKIPNEAVDTADLQKANDRQNYSKRTDEEINDDERSVEERKDNDDSSSKAINENKVTMKLTMKMISKRIRKAMKMIKQRKAKIVIFIMMQPLESVIWMVCLMLLLRKSWQLTIVVCVLNSWMLTVAVATARRFDRGVHDRNILETSAINFALLEPRV
jgi:hypothetical protein